MYHHGWGIKEDKNKAKIYFQSLESLYEETLKNPQDYYFWSLERIKDAYEYANNYLLGWEIDSNNYFELNDDIVCTEASSDSVKGLEIGYLVSSCFDLANAGNVYAATEIIEFYTKGIGVNIDIQHAYNFAADLLINIDLKGSKYEKYLNKAYTDPKDKKLYTQDLREIIKLKMVYMLIDGNVSGVKPETAFNLLQDTLLDKNGNYDYKKLNNPYYFTEFHLFSKLKTEGWGTSQDLLGATKLINKLKHNIKFLQNNPDQLDTDLVTMEDINYFAVQIYESEDRLNQIKSGFDIKSVIPKSFPAQYRGTFQFYSGLSHKADLNINKASQIGLDKFLLSGELMITRSYGTNERYLVSGTLDETSKLITLEEYDIGDFGTIGSDYLPGNYFGSFNEDYSTFQANFVGLNNEHANLELYKIDQEENSFPHDYKKMLSYW